MVAFSQQLAFLACCVSKVASSDVSVDDIALLQRPHLEVAQSGGSKRELREAAQAAWKAAKAARNAMAPLSAPLSGVWPSMDGRMKLMMAQDINFPPYAFITDPLHGGEFDDYHLTGIGHDMIHGMGDLCDWDVTVVQTPWTDCWAPGTIGRDLLAGVYHGCMTYTHTAGERNRHVEFSDSILQHNKPAGLVTRLDAEGRPVIDGTHNLTDVKVVDVTGWAPTADTLARGINDCTNTSFAGFQMLPLSAVSVREGSTANDAALEALLDGRADAMWIYADQAYNFRANQSGVIPSWNESLWSRLGKPNGFAYIHTGMLEHAYNGTTIAMSKKGSGLAERLNPCLKRYLQTEHYYETCKKYHVEGACFPNKFFKPEDLNTTKHVYELSTPDLRDHAEGGCEFGYCLCTEAAAATSSS